MRDRFGWKWLESGVTPWRQPHLSRRVFFRQLAAGVGGYFLLPVRPMETVARAAVAPISKAKYCVMVLMAGGPSHLDTFDLKEGAWTPSFFNPTSFNGVRFPQGLMPRIAEQLDSVAFVRSVRSWALVHGLVQTWVQIARNPLSGLSKIAPHIGSVVSLELGSQSGDQVLPAFISLNASTGPDHGYFPPQHGPFYVSPGGGGLPNSTHPLGSAAFQRRYDMLLHMDAEERAAPSIGGGAGQSVAFNEAARKLVDNAAVRNVFTFDQNQRNLYGNTSFGNACIAARNLIRADLGTRFIQITIGGWDNHTNIYQPNAALQAASRQFDQGLGALIADLKAEGLLEQTLIVALGEFGRTVGPLNSSAGRDHWAQQAVLFAGAGIRGPKAIGATDAVARETTEPGWARDRDIRHEDIAATIYSAMGIDWTTVRRDDPFRRGFEYIPFAASEDRYGPVHELWM